MCVVDLVFRVKVVRVQAGLCVDVCVDITVVEMEIESKKWKNAENPSTCVF